MAAQETRKAGFVAFCSGCLVMVLEMAGVRSLAPYIGSSALVWSAMIGIILAGLALGNFFGGKLADRGRPVSFALLAAGLSSGWSAVSCFYCGSFASGVNIYLAAIVCPLVSFFPAALCFGMVSPMAAKMAISSKDSAGQSVGKVFALSTAGSIIGTFLGGFILISFLPTLSILYGVSLAAILMALVLSKKRLLAAFLGAVCLAAFALNSGHVKSVLDNLNMKMFSGKMGDIFVMDNGGFRYLLTKMRGGAQAVEKISDSDALVFGYSRDFAEIAKRHRPKKILMLGGGGYSIPKWLVSEKSGLDIEKVDVVEIDPEMTEVARKLFSLPDNPAINPIHEDARAFLNRNDEKYDLIFVDAFTATGSVPFHVATREAFERIKDSLAPGGIVNVNVMDAIDRSKPGFAAALAATMKEVFPFVSAGFCVNAPLREKQNLLLTAGLEDVSKLLLPGKRIWLKDGTILTDAFAPAERLALE